jgi:hypothetical protein
VRGEKPAIRDQRAARRGHQGGEPLQQLHGIQEERGRSVAPRPPQLVEQLPAHALCQSVERQRRAHQTFQLIPSARRHRDIRMQAGTPQAGPTAPTDSEDDSLPRDPAKLPR